jgi:hypothetical protein
MPRERKPMQFIRFMQLDPTYGECGLSSEVIVQVGQIVKIEPLWTDIGEDGRKTMKYVGPNDDSGAIDVTTHKEFIVKDSLGNSYSSDTASKEAHDFIESLWRSAL